MKQGSTRAAVLLIAPAITVLAVVIGYPIVRAVYLSFQSDKHLDPVTGVFVQGGVCRFLTTMCIGYHSVVGQQRARRGYWRQISGRR